MSSTRRLAATLAADVAGNSRLIGSDEEGARERLKAHFRELLDPEIEEHHGRTVKRIGDGLPTEFASPLDVLRCASEIRAGIAVRNAAVLVDERIEFRIGSHPDDNGELCARPLHPYTRCRFSAALPAHPGEQYERVTIAGEVLRTFDPPYFRLDRRRPRATAGRAAEARGERAASAAPPGLSSFLSAPCSRGSR